MPLTDDSPAGESIYDVVQQPFQPHQPESVQPTSSPAPSSTPGSVGGTSGEDGEAAEMQAQAGEPEEPLPEFDPRHREAFTGLLYLGRLTKTLTLWGHTFVIKTLTTEESAEIGLFVAQYEGTRAASAVYQAAVVALSVVSVDGQPMPGEALGPNDSVLPIRYDYVSKNWSPPVREAIWNEVFLLEEIVRAVLEQMGKAQG